MVNLFDFSKNQSTVPNATGYLSKFTPKPAPVLNFGAPMSGTTQFSESGIKQAPKPTAPTSGGFSLVPKASAMEEQEDLLQIYLKDPKQDNNSKKELFKALQDGESPDNLIKYLQDSGYKGTQSVQITPKTERNFNIAQGLVSSLQDRYNQATESRNPLISSLNLPVIGGGKKLQVSGALGGAVGDVGGAIIQSLLPMDLKEKADNLFGKENVDYALNTIKAGGQIYEQARQQNPDLFQYVEDVANTASVTTAGPVGVKSATTAGKGVVKGAEKIADTTKKLLPKTDVEKIDLETTDLIRKAVRPSTTGVDTSGKYAQQDAKLLQGVKEVVNQGFKPKDAKEAMEAINKTKQNIWAKVQQGNQQVTKTTNGNEIGSDIYKFLNDSDNDAIFRANPELETRLIKYAEEIAGNRRFQNLTQDQLQELLTDVNSKIPSTAFLKQLDTNPIETQKNAVLAIILRDKLENNLMEAIGTNNQALRNSYGAVRQLEKDLARRYGVYARQNPEGLADMFGIDAIPEMIMGVLRGDIGGVVGGLAKRTLIGKLKQANNPNNIIKDIFSKQAKIKNLPSKPSSNVRINPNNTPIINSNKPLQNNKTTVKVLSDREKALIKSNKEQKSKPIIKSPLSERERKLLKPEVKSPVKTQLETTLKGATTSNIDEVVSNVAKTLKTTKTAEIKSIIQRYLKEFGKDFKNKIGEMIDEISEKIGAKLNLISDKQGIGVEKTALLKGSDDLKPIKKLNTGEDIVLVRGTGGGGSGAGEAIRGKGLYLTDNINVANHYGKNIEKVTIKNSDILDGNEMLKNSRDIIGKLPKEMQNYLDKDFKYSYNQLIRDIEGNTGLEAVDIAESINNILKSQYKGVKFNIGLVNDSLSEKGLGDKNAFLIFPQAQKSKPLKKAEPKGSDDLIEEAKKYKSAEEFIDNNIADIYGDKFFHGSTINIPEIKVLNQGGELGQGFYITNNATLAKDFVEKQLGKQKSVVNKIGMKGVKMKFMTKRDYVSEVRKYNNSEDFRKDIINEGYDGIWSPDTNQGVIFPEKVKKLKTETQLKQIYEQAQKSKPLKKSN